MKTLGDWMQVCLFHELLWLSLEPLTSGWWWRHQSHTRTSDWHKDNRHLAVLSPSFSLTNPYSLLCYAKTTESGRYTGNVSRLSLTVLKISTPQKKDHNCKEKGQRNSRCKWSRTAGACGFQKLICNANDTQPPPPILDKCLPLLLSLLSKILLLRSLVIAIIWTNVV